MRGKLGGWVLWTIGLNMLGCVAVTKAGALTPQRPEWAVDAICWAKADADVPLLEPGRRGPSREWRLRENYRRCTGSAERHAQRDVDEEVASYPRYAWAVDEECWSDSLQVRRRAIEQQIQMRSLKPLHEDPPHEAAMNRAYESCISSRPLTDEEINRELATYPRYEWATDDECWDGVAEDRRELLVRHRAHGSVGRPSFAYERNLRTAYNACQSRQAEAAMARRADDPDAVAAAVETLARPDWVTDSDCWPVVVDARKSLVRDYWRTGRHLPSPYDIAWRRTGERELYEECIDKVTLQRETEIEKAAAAELAGWLKDDARLTGTPGVEANLFGEGASVSIFVDRDDPRQLRVQREGKDVVLIDACKNLRDCPKNRVYLSFGVTKVDEGQALLVFRTLRRSNDDDGTVDATAFVAASDCALTAVAHVSPGAEYVAVRRELTAELKQVALPKKETLEKCHRPVVTAMGGDRRAQEAEVDEFERAALAAAERRARRDAVLRQCGGRILEQQEFVMGRNPHADKGKCVDIVALTLRMDSTIAGLFDLGGGLTGAIRFKQTFRGAGVDGTVRVVDVKNVQTSKRVEQVVVLEMLDVRRAMTGR